MGPRGPSVLTPRVAIFTGPRDLGAYKVGIPEGCYLIFFKRSSGNLNYSLPLIFWPFWPIFDHYITFG